VLPDGIGGQKGEHARVYFPWGVLPFEAELLDHGVDELLAEIGEFLLVL